MTHTTQRTFACVAIALIVACLGASVAIAQSSDAKRPHLGGPKRVVSELWTYKPQYDVLIEADGQSYKATKTPIKIQLYSSALKRWGEWHSIPSFRHGSTIQNVVEAPGFVRISKVRVYLDDAPIRLRKVRLLGVNGSSYDFTKAQTLDDNLLVFANPQTVLKYCCPDWSSSCQCTGVIDCVDMMTSPHCDGSVDWGSCADDPGETCGTCTNKGGNCGDSPGCGEDNPCTD